MEAVVEELGPEVSLRLRREAEAAYPRECCGVLLGDEHGLELLPLPNRAPNPLTGFQLAAEDLLAVETASRREGARIVGYYHSHPDGSTAPSAEDRAGSVPGTLQVIVPVTSAGAGSPVLWTGGRQERH